MSQLDKVVLFNAGALRGKYSSTAWKNIKKELERLVSADKKRGFTTHLVAVDSKTTMKKLGAAPVVNSQNRRQHKFAVDGVVKALEPAYVMILGSDDTFPHQRLVSPLKGPDADEDAYVPSDLPYACDAGYSNDIQDFLGPTRVVGRLPDVEGSGDSRYLIKLLKFARSWSSRPRKDYDKYFGVTAEVWKGSTTRSLKTLFGSSSRMKESPPKSPPWPAPVLSPRSHFINCHGVALDPCFYGEGASGGYPVSHDAAQLGRVVPDTVAAAECCYGAQLYDPSALGVHRPICNEYLAQGALGFLGSTTIAYGPADGTGAADIICIEFMKAVLGGASLGRALLEARQKYMTVPDEEEPIAHKTLAQFLLLGDPSIHPVAKPAVAASKKTSKKSKVSKKKRTSTKAKAEPGTHRDRRRKRLAKKGAEVAKNARKLARRKDRQVTPKLTGRLGKLAKELGARNLLTFQLKPSTAEKSAARSKVAKKTKKKTARNQGTLGAYHVMFGPKQSTDGTRIKTRTVFVIKEVSGRVKQVRQLRER